MSHTPVSSARVAHGMTSPMTTSAAPRTFGIMEAKKKAVAHMVSEYTCRG